MLLVKDEMVLHLEGHIRGHPRIAVEPELGKLMNSRQWSTTQVMFAADNKGEESADRKRKGKKLYPVSFSMGLDHIPNSDKDWFADVRAIVEFFHPIARETGSTFLLQFRLKSKPGYMITLQTIDQKEIDETDLTAIKLILENEIKQNQKRPWWRKLLRR